MRQSNSIVATVVCVALASPVHGQSLRSLEDDGRMETRAMMGITIPLEGKSARRNTQPRLDLRFDMSRINGDPLRTRTLNPLLKERRDVRATTLSLTFEQNPKLLLNAGAFTSLGSPILASAEQQEEEEVEKEERSTGQKILRGTGWAGIGALALVGGSLGYLFVRCSGDDSDCFDDE